MHPNQGMMMSKIEAEPSEPDLGQLKRTRALTRVHVGNRIPTAGAFIGISRIFGRVLIRTDAPIKQMESYNCLVSPLKRQEFGCNWSVRKVLKAKKYGLPPEKISVKVVSKSVDGKFYLCNQEGASSSVCVYPSDIKEVLAGDLETGKKIEVVCYKESGRNEFRVCCLASVLPNEIAPTAVKMEPPPIGIGASCPDQCPDLELLRSFVAAAGLDVIEKELGTQLSESINSVIRSFREVKME